MNENDVVAIESADKAERYRIAKDMLIKIVLLIGFIWALTFFWGRLVKK